MRYLTGAAVVAATVGAMLVAAMSASAATAPGYEEFGGCPDKSVNPSFGLCITSTVTGGHLQLGNTDTPIVDPIEISGSLTQTLPQEFVVGEFDGGRQPVPGGLIGISGLNWLVNLFPANLLKVYAEAQLAGAPTRPDNPPVYLPLKVRLHNPLLSSTCYIGSDTNPLELNLTTGTTAPPPPNQPISGHPATSFGLDPNLPGVLRINELLLVDNAFAAPAASGCDLIPVGVIDALVNLQAGLPSPAGTNEAVQEADGALTSLNTVYPPDGIEQP
jgi:hypothetical protein